VLGHQHFEQLPNVVEFGEMLPGGGQNAGLRQHGTQLLTQRFGLSGNNLRIYDALVELYASVQGTVNPKRGPARSFWPCAGSVSGSSKHERAAAGSGDAQGKI